MNNEKIGKGDSGITNTKNNKILSKDTSIIEFIGQLDSLNAMTGWANVLCNCKILYIFQKSLLKIGGYIEDLEIISDFLKNQIIQFETFVHDLYLPKIYNFVIPANDELSTRLHIVRTEIRKTERFAVKLDLPKILIAYLNRASTLLFALARKAMLDSTGKEIFWKNDDF